MSRKFQRRTLFTKHSNGGAWKSYALYLASFLILLYGAIFLWPVVPGASNIPGASAYKVKIAPQSGLSAISNQLSEQGISTHPLTLQIAARALFVGSKLKPGS